MQNTIPEYHSPSAKIEISQPVPVIFVDGSWNRLRSHQTEAFQDFIRSGGVEQFAKLKKEGFVMPNGKANVRTHNLGNYKPTLLKFKKQEANNGG